MASSSIAGEGTSRRQYAVTDWLGGWRVCLLAWLGVSALFLGLSTYMHAFAWSAGIDSASREFTLYWRSLLIVELVGVAGGTLCWWSWLVRSGRTIQAALTHAEEVRRIAVFWGLIGATSLVLYFMASFFVNADGAWHQTAVRDTAFTPPHIVMFYCAFPLGITMTVGTYLYGVTRLPRVYPAGAGFPWSFFLLIAASVTEMLQVAFNEWGHSLWIPEEIFAAPLHWPFVIYVWLAAAMFALWLETLLRLLGIEKEIADQRAQAAHR
jgi:methane/ammonia monooxygenase subunit C